MHSLRPSPVFITPDLPHWIRDWAKAVLSATPAPDADGEAVQVMKGEDTLKLLVADPDIAQSLIKEHRALSRADPAGAKSLVLHFIAAACVGHALATRKSFVPAGEVTKDLVALAKSAKKLATNIRTLKRDLKGAIFPDAIPHLIDQDPSSKSSAKGPLRGARYEIGDPPRLPDVLEAFALALNQQVEFRKTLAKRTGRIKPGGANAIRNFQIAHLIRHSREHWGYVPEALIASVVAVANDCAVDESDVRHHREMERAPIKSRPRVIRKMRAKKR